MVRQSGISGLFVAALLTVSYGSPATAQNGSNDSPPPLEWPVDCALGQTCWISRYVDRSPGPEKTDYLCKPQTEDKHKGTDIALRDFGVMEKGVAVRAAAAGRVLALRDGMPDIIVTKERRAQILKQGCGNVIIIGHGGGWQTQYCHLKKDSLLVKNGDMVAAGQPIGQVGLSGITEYPHLHFMVQRRESRQKIQYFDPFDGGVFERSCKTGPNGEHKSFWKESYSHVGPVVMPPLVSDTRITRATLWQPQVGELPPDTPVLFIQARGFHTLPGDIWRFSMTGPDGTTKFTYDVEQTRQRQLVGANSRFPRPVGGYATGPWTATVTLLRDGVLAGSARSGFHISPD